MNSSIPLVQQTSHGFCCRFTSASRQHARPVPSLLHLPMHPQDQGFSHLSPPARHVLCCAVFFAALKLMEGRPDAILPFMQVSSSGCNRCTSHLSPNLPVCLPVFPLLAFTAGAPAATDVCASLLLLIVCCRTSMCRRYLLAMPFGCPGTMPGQHGSLHLPPYLCLPACTPAVVRHISVCITW